MLVYRSICEEELKLLKQNIIAGSPNPIYEGIDYHERPNLLDNRNYNENTLYKHLFLFAEDAFAYRNINDNHKYVVQCDIPIDILESHLFFGSYTIVNLRLVDEEIENGSITACNYEDFFIRDDDDFCIYSLLPEFPIPIEEFKGQWIKDFCGNEKIPDNWRRENIHKAFLCFLIDNGYYRTVIELESYEIKKIGSKIASEVFNVMDNIENKKIY